ncbi:MAG TPA: hypothetical protein VH595_01180 [Verrucomicrobiae bacterium]|jgi:hypothetical protein|nr:hypothetical protein [Verrucomicrobiae bacterium]
MRLYLTLFFAMALSVGAAPIVVTIDPKSSGAEISPDFIGLSYEMSTVLPGRDGRYFFRSDNKPLIELFHTLGVKSLRVGGNTADRESVRVPGKPDIDSLFAFAKAADVKVLYTLRLNEGETKTVVPGPSKAGSKESFHPYDPKADAEIAKYIQDHYSAQLSCFIIGNEPDHYCTDFPMYKADWERFADAVSAAVPDARFCGPSTTPGRVVWAGDFASELGKEQRIAFITQHNYAAGSGRTTNISVARERLLSPNIEHAYEKVYDAFVPAVLNAGQHYRLEECNSLSNGGGPGVSDALASALWGVDYMYWWALHSASGLNFHTGPRSMKYAVFVIGNGGYDVHPLGYALKAFELGSHGHFVPVKESPGHDNLRTYAVLGDDGYLYVTFINREHSAEAHPLDITLDAGTKIASSQIMFLEAPGDNIKATSGITLGGASINSGGDWTGAWSPLNSSQFHLAPATVAVVKFSVSGSFERLQ